MYIKHMQTHTLQVAHNGSVNHDRVASVSMAISDSFVFSHQHVPNAVSECKWSDDPMASLQNVAYYMKYVLRYIRLGSLHHIIPHIYMT